MAVASVLMAVTLARYVDRLPDDWVGIGLFSAALVGFLITFFGSLVRWRNAAHFEREQTASARTDHHLS